MSMGFTLPRRSAVFIADAQGLDFLNSARASSDGPIDWLQNGEALLRWLEQSAIEPPESIQWLQAHWSAAELDAIAGQARDLRAWFGEFVRAHMGRSLDGSEPRELEHKGRHRRPRYSAIRSNYRYSEQGRMDERMYGGLQW